VPKRSSSNYAAYYSESLGTRKSPLTNGSGFTAGFSARHRKEVSAIVKYRSIFKNRTKYPVTAMCHFFEVSRSGYYDFVKRIDMPDRDEPLAQLIEERRSQRYGKTLGCRKMQLWLDQEKRKHYNYKTIWRVMHKYGLLSVVRRHRYYRPSEVLHVYPNLLNRAFEAQRPNEKWVTDISYIRTQQGTLYLSIIRDLFDGSIVAYKTSTLQNCKLVFDTIKAAMKKERVTTKLQLHSDQGFQYTSTGYYTLTQKYGITPSMSRRGNPYDNALAENFFGMLKTECIYLCKPKTISQAKMLISDYIDYFNNERIQLKTKLTPLQIRCQFA
jgi:transposase InsO family protein